MKNQITTNFRQTNHLLGTINMGQSGHQLNSDKMKASTSSKKGKVILVGAGPNDPELLTIKAYQALQKADVVVFDRLVGHEILDLIPEHCEQVYVGKRCGQPSLKQEEINQILIEQAEQGKQVVRLKGGDPFIFGRGGEEALALIAQGIQYDVIPGITAAIGCAASAKIPLTHRGVSRSVTLVTGHVMNGAFDSWTGLVGSGQTVVFYMGLEQAQSIQQGLHASGLSASTPIAIIGNGCSPKQETYTATLDSLASLANQLKDLTPALIVVGEVVALREQLMMQLTENTRLPL